MCSCMIRNIIWDVDGTLLDTYPAITRAFVWAMADLGAAVDGAHVLELALIGLGRCAATLAQEAALDVAAVEAAFDARYEAIPPGEQGPFPGAREVCRAVVDEGGKNAVVTHRARASTLGLLGAHGMGDLFSAVASVEDGYPKKPDPAAFLAVLRHCSLDPAQTLAVGDREIDIRAGRAAGLRTALFGNSQTQVEPDLRIRTYAELLPLVGWRGTP